MERIYKVTTQAIGPKGIIDNESCYTLAELKENHFPEELITSLGKLEEDPEHAQLEGQGIVKDEATGLPIFFNIRVIINLDGKCKDCPNEKETEMKSVNQQHH